MLTSCIAAAETFEGEVVGEIPMGEGRMPIPRLSAPAPTRETTGTIDAMALYAGQSVGSVTDRQTADAILRNLADEAERLLRRCG